MNRVRCRVSFAILVLGLNAATFAAPPTVRSPVSGIPSIQSAVRDVIERAAPSVYAVTSFASLPGEADLWQGDLSGATFAALADRQSRNCGSAFAIDDQGTLLTNEHVVSGSPSVWVTDDAGRVWPALVVATDPRSDLAVLRIPTATRPLPLAHERFATRGDLVLTLGNPDGLAAEGGASASLGMLSAVRRSLPTLSSRERRAYVDLIQTTTPVTVGSSGGPLLDLQGDVIGLITAVAPSDKERDAVGFAIDLTRPGIRAIVDELVAGREVMHGYLGVTVAPSGKLPGAQIDAIEPGTPADGVLYAGDIVLRYGDQPIETGETLARLSATSPVDQDVPLRIDRAGRQLDLTIRPRRRAMPAEPVARDTQTLAWAGAAFRNAPGGGVEVVESDTPSLQPGSIIDSIDRKRIADLTDLLATLHDGAGQPLKIAFAPR